MSLSLSPSFAVTFNLAVVALLPLLVSAIAGVLRQDRLPTSVNQAISLALAVLAGLFQALEGGKLGGSPIADFLIVSAYTTAVMHSPLFLQLQDAIQSNVFTVGKPQPPTPPPSLPVAAPGTQLPAWLQPK